MVYLLMYLHKALFAAISMFLVNECFLVASVSADLNFEFEQRKRELRELEKMQKMQSNEDRKRQGFDCEEKRSKAGYVSKQSNSMHNADILIDDNGYLWRLSYRRKNCMRSVIRNSSTGWTTYYGAPPVKLGKVYKWVKRGVRPETGRVQFIIKKGIIYKINIGSSGRASKCIFAYPVKFYQPEKARLRLPIDFTRDYECDRYTEK